MQIAKCRNYHSKTVDRDVIRMPDGKSVFKIYYLSLIGRDDPARYEWGRGRLTTEECETMLQASGIEGIGFITAFPHILKVFRFAPSMETVLHVKAFNTGEGSALQLSREDGYTEFACYAEAAIAAEEYGAWARAETVDEYLEFQSRFVDGPVGSHTKLAAYWGR